ncbi:MAG: DNA mismatch repair protein MutL, partial [Phycisphaerales bacterium]
YETPRGGGGALAPPAAGGGFQRQAPGGAGPFGWRDPHGRGDDEPGAQAAQGCGLGADLGEAGGPAVPAAAGDGLMEAAPPRRPAIQLHNTYLVVETDDGLLIIDQHALHERIMFDQLSRRILEGPLESQRLLLPETMPAAAADVALLETHGELLAELGIEAAPIGQDAVAVHAFPSILKRANVASFMRDLLDGLAAQDGDRPREAMIHAVLDMMACKAAVKAGDPLTPAEIDALVSHKALVEKSSNCPHGRPTTLRLTRADLERQFKRT